MLQFGRHFYNTISNILTGTEQNKEVKAELKSQIPELQIPLTLSMQFYDSDRYQPSFEDVLTVKNILFTLRPDAPLPLELIDAILDLSEYWPHTTTVPGHQGVTLARTIILRAGGQGENRLILRSLPIGYPQGNSSDQSFQIRPEEQINYSTKEPKPWPQDREVPKDATEEVIKKWTASSQVRGEFPCKKIVFRIKSHDQGWGGVSTDKGSYRGSYTWFDVGLERLVATTDGPFPDGAQFHLYSADAQASESTKIVCGLKTISPDTQKSPENPQEDTVPDSTNSLIFKHALNPDHKYLQKNKTATSASQEHTIVWRFHDDIHPESPEADELEVQGRGKETANGEFVRSLKIGDVVTIWAKARYPGWANTVEDVSVDVYWSV